MKRILAALLTVFMALNIAAITPAMAAAGIPDANYTFLDTAYSPELGMYIAVAKNADGNSWIYKSTNESDWEKTRTSTLVGVHYANKQTRQSVVWWEKIQKFVFIMNNEIYTYDGERWDKVGAYRSNSTVAASADKLVTATGRRINVWDDLTKNGANAEGFTVDHVVSQTGSIYMHATAISDSGVAASANADYVWEIEHDKDDPSKMKEYSRVKQNGTLPLDMIYVSEIDSFIVLTEQYIRVVPANPQNMAMTDISKISLSDGTVNKDKITAIGGGNGYVLLGTSSGKMLISPAEDIEGGTWQIIEPRLCGENTDEMRSITAVDENMFFAVSAKKIFFIKKGGDGTWNYYDTDSTSVGIEGQTRIEIPDDRSETAEINAVPYGFDGRVTTEPITSFTNITPLPEGVTSELMGDSTIRITVSPDVVGEHEITYKTVSQLGNEAEATVKIVDEDYVDIRGNDAMVLPAENDPAEQYRYEAVAVGTDGEDMARPTVLEVLEMPEGVEYDETTQTFTIKDTSAPGKIVLKAYSNHYPDKGTIKEIVISPREIGSVKFRNSESEIEIPDNGNKECTYEAVVYDQANKPMLKEKAIVTLSAKDISSMNGISFKEENNSLKINSEAVHGTVVLKAAAQNKPEIFTEKEITLTYTDKRSVKEDIVSLKLDSPEPFEKNLELPANGPFGSKLKYESSDESLLLPDGTIIRPSREDKKVTVSVSAKKGTAEAKESYTITIKKADNLCVNGDFADSSVKGWNPIGETALGITSEDGTKIMRVDGEGAYQTLTLTNDSSYGFTARVKAEAGKTISLVSDKGKTLASVIATGEWQEIKANYDYRRQNDSFEDNIYLKYNGVMSIDYLKIFETTLEYQKVMQAVNKAEYSKKKADVDAAKELLEDFYDLPVKDELKNRLDSIKTTSSRPTGGGGGGGTSPSNAGGVKNPTNISTPTGKTDNFEDQLDTYLLTFKDMKTHWAREEVEALAKLELLQGDENGAFRPDDKISRAEFAAMLARAIGLDEEEYSNTFFDVVSDDWFSGYVQSVRSNNIMNGYDGLFNPKSMITREEIAKSVVSAYNMKANKTLERGKSLYFNDLEDVSSWAYDYIAEAAELGFVNGVTEELFKPKETATRAQAAVMLKRVYDELNPTEN